MKFILLIAVLSAVALGALIVVVALYRHKKNATGEVVLVGEAGQVNSPLDPEGTVLVKGELWRARSADSSFVPANSRVRIVETRDHLLIVTQEPSTT